MAITLVWCTGSAKPSLGGQCTNPECSAVAQELANFGGGTTMPMHEVVPPPPCSCECGREYTREQFNCLPLLTYVGNGRAGHAIRAVEVRQCAALNCTRPLARDTLIRLVVPKGS